MRSLLALSLFLKLGLAAACIWEKSSQYNSSRCGKIAYALMFNLVPFAL